MARQRKRNRTGVDAWIAEQGGREAAAFFLQFLRPGPIDDLSADFLEELVEELAPELGDGVDSMRSEILEKRGVPWWRCRPLWTGDPETDPTARRLTIEELDEWQRRRAEQ